MIKRIINKEDLLPKMKLGMEIIAGIVKRTLGPGGQPIFIERIGQMANGDFLGPKITRDGVSVAEECSDPDPEKDLIIQAVKSICRKTNSVAGDGTTTAIVLGEAIFNEMLSELESNPGLNPQLVRESVEVASREVLAQLKKRAKKVKNPKIIAQVAAISANGDNEIGHLIGQAFEAVGAEGVVVVDEGSGIQTTLDVVEGYQIQRGAEVRDAFFNNESKTQFEAKEVTLIIYDGKITNYTSLRPILQKVAEANIKNNRPTMPPVVIMANEFSSEVAQWLLIQKIDGGMSFCPIKGPNTTSVRSGYYEDIAVMSGGSRLGNGGASLEAAELEDLGVISRVVIDKYTSTFYDGQGEEGEILKRVDQLKAMREQAESPYDEQILSDRIAALTQGIAKIGVGGATDLEIKEKYDRIEDALNAARAAILEGVVPGGGVTLLKIAVDMEARSIGHKILKQALQAPFYQILENIAHGLTQAEYEEIIKGKDAVYDARHKCVSKAFKAGILDPVKVTRTGLENAISIAALLSTAGGGIIYERKEKSD